MIMPAWLPVNDRASWPMLRIAIASSAIEMRSPAVSSMSSSRGAGSSVTWCARSSSSSVVSPIAETATTTSLPGLAGLDDALRDPLDALGVRDGRAAELLHDEAHQVLPDSDKGVYRRHACRIPRPHRLVPAVRAASTCCPPACERRRQAARRNGMSALFTVSGACSAG